MPNVRGKRSKDLACAAMVSALALLCGWCWAGEEAGTDATTGASTDASTWATPPVEDVRVTDKFAVDYQTGVDGALILTAEALIAAYEKDELAADGLFKDKALSVTGVVDKTSKPGSDKPWVSMKSRGGGGKKVRCSLKPGQEPPAGAGEGSVLRVAGVCDGMKLSIALRDGVLQAAE